MTHSVRIVVVTLISVAMLGLGAAGLAHPLPLAYALGLAAAYQTVAPGACAASGLAPSRSFQVYRIRPTPKGFMVFYTAECGRPGRAATAISGHVEFLQHGLRVSAGWREQETDLPSYSGAQALFGVYNLHGSHPERDAYTLVVGRVLTAGAVSVAVTFANGEVLRDRLSGGRFAILLPKPVRACRLHMLDRWGSVLVSYDVSRYPAPARAEACAPG